MKKSVPCCYKHSSLSFLWTADIIWWFDTWACIVSELAWVCYRSWCWFVLFDIPQNWNNISKYFTVNYSFIDCRVTGMIFSSWTLVNKVMVEAYRRDASSKDQLISELKATKKRLDSEMKELKRELLQIQVEKQSLETEHSKLQKEVTEVHQQMVEIENHLQSVQKERDEMETRLQVWELLSFGHWGSITYGICCYFH